jgi:hypothetical protein
MKSFRISILVFLASVPAVLAQQVTYSSNFDNTTEFPAGETLSSYTTAELPANNSDQNLDWITTNTDSDGNPAKPTDSILPANSNLAQYSGDQWAIMGGLVGLSPSQNTVELWNPVSIKNAFNFSMEYDVTESGGAYTNNDAFGVTFRTPTDLLLFQILFTPDASNPSTVLDVDWNTGSGETSTGLQINRNADYNISVAGNLNLGTFAATISSVGVVSSDSFNGAFSNTGQTLGEAGVTWNILNGSAGNNSIAFNNYAVVPEPSAYIGLVLGSVMLMMWQMRRRTRQGNA